MGTDLPAVCIDPTDGLDALVSELVRCGYRVVGPVVRDGVIALDEVRGDTELPIGWRVVQHPGRFELLPDNLHPDRRFGWTPGADSWKRWMFPPRSEVVRIRRHDDTWVATTPPPPDRPLALLGARACELRALDVLDRVVVGGDHPDPRYAARRAGTFVVAVTCTVPSDTCWCTSTGGDPEPGADVDIRLTELGDEVGDEHRLLLEPGTDRGAAVVAALAGRAATDADRAAARAAATHARAALAPRVEARSLPDRLRHADLDPWWDDVAGRCLSCTNCTSVCPTCFCSSFVDTTSIPDAAAIARGEDATTVREQTWVSCFELDHSNLGGRPVRATTAARYRQWLMHKLVTWQDQWGVLGCVGCGRCSTWCPAGIDLPAEAEALVRSQEGSP